jgi:hypothetical protein
MKKALAGFLLLGMVTVAAFAEINITGFASGAIVPFYTQDGESTVGNGPYWGGIGPQIQLAAAGANPTGKAGFMFSIVASIPDDRVATSPLHPGQENYIWLKPFSDFLTFKAGGFNDDTLKGGDYSSGLLGSANITKNGEFGFAPPGTPPQWQHGEWQAISAETVFAGYGPRVDGGFATRNPGALLAFTPITNLFVGAGFQLNKHSFAFEADKIAADYYIDGQYAVGYTIDSIGQIKAQYLGRDTGRGITTYYDNGTKLLQAAFKLTMLSVGPIEAGVTIPLDYDDDNPDGYTDQITVAAGTSLLFGKFGLKAYFTGGFGGSRGKDFENGMLLLAGLEPRYAITDTIAVSAPVGITYRGTSTFNGTDVKDDASFIDFGVAVHYDLGVTWNVNAGVVYATQLSHGDGISETKPKFAIPIYFSGVLF